ncbi:hypothetical protein L227DRAFT_580931 [Lentinus tigrinus ALCF2SS1-6]|uniref:Uncharacterized protein n=1 Tax=Lentinus tigrinus ALCF2SS1-6 TaxID=1328759 RepID=A0A5C2RTL8_9APHY|nr:hypothetical protein L227DRAFT_580931 [Lentinus tigrinus ALCF2SS1-6]
MACGRDRSEDHERPTTPSCSQSWELGTAFFPSSPVSTSSGLDDQSADERGDGRIGKTSGRPVSALSLFLSDSEWRVQDGRETCAPAVDDRCTAR